MDVSADRPREVWLNELFGLTSVPANCRDNYPFSKCPAVRNRIKLTGTFLHFLYTLWVIDDPCKRHGLLFIIWLQFVLCEILYRNYPWREPLTDWYWRIYLAVPYPNVLFSLCALLLPLCLVRVSAGCELPDPWGTAMACWLSGLLIWPRVRQKWRREEAKDGDYDQFSSVRPTSLTFPFAPVVAVLRSPSLLFFGAGASAVALLVPAKWAPVLTASLGTLALALFCCDRLPEDLKDSRKKSELEEQHYIRKIIAQLQGVNGNLQFSGLPVEDTGRFDRLAVQVPLLLREARILRKTCRTLRPSDREELDRLTTTEKVLQLRRRLDDYGPYHCCVS